MGFPAKRAVHSLNPKDRPHKGGLSPVAAVLDEYAFTSANPRPKGYGLQVNLYQLRKIGDLCNRYIDKG
jgi:hypothetical protein